MSEASKDFGASAESDKLGPDYFAFYTHEVAELLSQTEDFLPFSSETPEFAGRTYGVFGEKDVAKHNSNGEDKTHLGSLFSNSIEAGLSDFKKERLKVLLRQSVVALSPEVDEMLDPVLAIRRINSHMSWRKSLSNKSAALCEGGEEQHPCKKIKLSSSSSSISNPLHGSIANGRVSTEESGEGKDTDVLEKGIANGDKNCAHFHTMETSKWRKCSEGPKPLCDSCGIKFIQEKEPTSKKEQIKESCLVSNTGAADEVREVDNALQFLLENDPVKVEESVKKQSDEISIALGHMEQQLEELLNTVVSNSRLMTLCEKQQLQKLIRKLPPRNLDRVVEIIRHNKPPGKYSSDEIHVDLEKQDNATLWRLYYYAECVENARKLPRIHGS